MTSQQQQKIPTNYFHTFTKKKNYSVTADKNEFRIYTLTADSNPTPIR